MCCYRLSQSSCRCLKDTFSATSAYPSEGRFLTIATALVTPAGRMSSVSLEIRPILTCLWRALGGTVTLASSDPFEDPLIDPAFLTSEFDLFVIREAARAGRVRHDVSCYKRG